MRLRNLLLLSLIILVGFGCSPASDDSAGAPTAPVEPFVQGQMPDGEIPDLYYHQVFFATGEAGGDWEVGDVAIAEHGSVPDLTRLDQAVGDVPAGALLSYFVDSSPVIEGLDEQVSFIVSLDDGETWSDRIVTEIDENYLPVDPSVIQLDDGRLRMHFFDFSSTRGGGAGKTHVFYSAISEDGIHFEIEGASLSSEALMTDPEVIAFNGKWFMYFAMHEGEDRGMWVATSGDGIVFENPVKIPEIMGIPGAMVVGGQVQLYGCDGGIVMTTSNDGIHFEELPATTVTDEMGPGGKYVLDTPALFQSEQFFCDPSPALLSDGSIGLVLKTIVEN